jgi:FkbM family methyltransferase
MSLLAKIRRVVNNSLIRTGFQIERSNIYLPFNFPIDRKYLRVPNHLRATNDFILRFSKNCDALIDIGANRGTFTDFFLATNKDIRSYLFEPLPELFKFLKLKYPNKSRIIIFNKAISNNVGTSFFHVAANDGQSSSLYEIGERHKQAAPHALEVKEIEVEVSTLDIILKDEIFENAFLKIDVQGAELQVLKGAANTLNRTAAIHVEVSIQSLYKGDTLGYEIWDYLANCGFTLYGMDPWFRDAKANGELLQCDLFFIKNHLLTNNL